MTEGFPDIVEDPSPEVLSPSAEVAARLLDRAAESGALLLRGTGFTRDVEFDEFVLRLGLPNFAYKDSLSNALRVNRTDRVFTANEAPAPVEIPLHHELAQTPSAPRWLIFFCERAPDAGGATPLCRSDRLLTALAAERPDFIEAIRAKGLRYTHVMPRESDAQSGLGRSWTDMLGVATRPEAEGRLRDLGYSWQWCEDDALEVTSPALPGVRRLPDGSESFFNQLIAATRGWKDSRNDPSRSLTLGDGSPLDLDAVELAVDLARHETVDVAWQRGDVAVVDNDRVMHGRRPFEGSRVVLASLCAEAVLGS